MQSRQALKGEILKLKAELRKAQSQLMEIKDELRLNQALAYFYRNRFEHYQEQCAKLEAERDALKKVNKRLENANKAMKAHQTAQNYNRKEA